MDSERVAAIRAALDEYDVLGEKSFYEISDHDNIRARNIRDDMPIWLRDLLTELDKAAAVVAAAREVSDYAHVLSEMMQKYEPDTEHATGVALRAVMNLGKLANALAAYDSGSEGGGE